MAIMPATVHKVAIEILKTIIIKTSNLLGIYIPSCAAIAAEIAAAISSGGNSVA